MKLHKTTAHRIAHVLESRGLLRRGLDSNRYRLGLHLYDLGCQALDHVNIRDEARPFMTRIALEVGETVHLAVLDRAEVLYIERVEAERSLTMGSKARRAQPRLLHCAGEGDSGVFPGYRSGADSCCLPDGSENQKHIYQRARFKAGVGTYS
jgi:IclR family transcriptional regulator, KDG regulon repressor